MKKDISQDLLKRYLRGETTAEESSLVDAWYLSLQEKPDDISLLDPLVTHIVENRILDRIKADIEWPVEALRPRKAQPVFFLNPLKLAAAMVAVAIIGIGAFIFTRQELPALETKMITEINGVKKASNATTTASELFLEDGTVIILKPNSSVEYPEKFSATDRKVQLIGEAFFNVTKDKNRPFIISTSDVNIRVLGTSFNVVAYEGSKEISVAVKTGRVSVYAKEKAASKNSRKIKEEVVLTPNQEVIYNTTREHFSKKLVAEPQIILEKPTLFETQYDGAPVVKILNVLKENYGVDIQYDEKALANCVLTTSMLEEGLYERIEIICKAIGAQYEIADAAIVIKSNGCH